MPTLTQPIHSENISPKTRFQMSGTKLSDHRDLVSSEAFRLAIDTALLQFQAEQSQKCTGQYEAMRMGIALAAVHEFIQVLRKLADKDDPKPMAPVNDNLPHR